MDMILLLVLIYFRRLLLFSIVSSWYLGLEMGIKLSDKVPGAIKISYLK